MASHQRWHVVIVAIVAVVGLYVVRPLAQQAASQPGPVVTAPGTSPTAPAGVPGVPAVSVTEVRSPAAPAHYGDQAIWALMISLLIQYLKKTTWFKWVTVDSPSQLKAQFGFIAALLTAAGIHFAVAGSILGDGGATVTISGLSLNAMKDVLWQWAAQQGWYRLVVEEPKQVVVEPPHVPVTP